MLNRKMLAILIVIATVGAMAAARAGDVRDVAAPMWVLSILLPGLNLYALVFGQMRDAFESWIAATAVIMASTAFWYFIARSAAWGLFRAARHPRQPHIAEPASEIVEPARDGHGLSSALLTFAAATSLIALLLLGISGPQYLSFSSDVVFAAVLPGQVANQLIPYGPFGEWRAMLVITVFAGAFWTAVLLGAQVALRRVVGRFASFNQ